MNSEITIKGIHTLRSYDMTTSSARRIEFGMQILQKIRPYVPQKLHRNFYEILFTKLQAYKVAEKTIENLVVTVGRSVLAQRIANVTTYTGIINYGALGTSSTAASNSDTQLGTEVFRKVTASTSYTTNVAFVDFFYTASDTNGTYQEFGTFIDGTGTANSGQMFSHFITGGWVKTSAQSMTVTSQYTFS